MMQAGKETQDVSTVMRLTCYASVHRFTDEEQTEVADKVLLKVQLRCNSLHISYLILSYHNWDPIKEHFHLLMLYVVSFSLPLYFVKDS